MRKKISEIFSQNKKKIIIGSSTVLVAAAVITVSISFANASSKDQETTTTTSAGSSKASFLSDAITGDGTVTAGSLYQMLDLDLSGTSSTGTLEIDTVNVSAGDEVSVGDALLTFTSDSVEDTRAILETALTEYEIQYEQAKVTYESDAIDAKAEYDKSLALKQTSESTYKDTLQSLVEAVDVAKNSLDEANSTVTDNTEKIATKKATLSNKTAKRKTVNNNLTAATNEYNKALTNYNKAKEEYEKKQTEYETIKTVFDYTSQYIKTSGSNKITEFVSSVSTEMKAKEKAYTDAKKTFEALEKTLATKEEKVTKYTESLATIDKSITTLKADIDSLQSESKEAKASLEQLQINYDNAKVDQVSGEASAKASYDTDMVTYNSALTNYQNTMDVLDETLDTAKENYTDAKNNLKVFKQIVGDGTLKAANTGTIESVSVEAGTNISQSTTIVSYVDKTALKVVVSIDQSDINDIAIGDSAMVASSSEGMTTGTVVSINRESTSTSVSSVEYEVTVSIESNSIASGNSVTVTFGSMMSNMGGMNKGQNTDN